MRRTNILLTLAAAAIMAATLAAAASASRLRFTSQTFRSVWAG